MAERTYDRNAGFVSLPQIPDDKFIVGVIVIMTDEDGNYSTEFIPESLVEVPSPEVQETLGGMAAQAFEIANITSGAPR